MEASFEVDKIIKCAIYNTVFFPLGGDDILMRLRIGTTSNATKTKNSFGTTFF